LPQNVEEAENRSRNLFDLFVTGTEIIEWHLTCLSGPWTLTQLRSGLNRDSRGAENNCLDIFPRRACTWPSEKAKIVVNMLEIRPKTWTSPREHVSGRTDWNEHITTIFRHVKETDKRF
jgi:hypothetical protein